MNVFRACVTATRRWPCVSFLLFPDLTFLSLPLDSRVDYPLASKVNTIILLRGWVITWSKGHQTISFVRLSWAQWGLLRLWVKHAEFFKDWTRIKFLVKTTDRPNRTTLNLTPWTLPAGASARESRAREHGRCKTGRYGNEKSNTEERIKDLVILLDWIGHNNMVLPEGHMYHGTTVPVEDGRHPICLVVENGASELLRQFVKPSW